MYQKQSRKKTKVCLILTEYALFEFKDKNVGASPIKKVDLTECQVQTKGDVITIEYFSLEDKKYPLFTYEITEKGVNESNSWLIQYSQNQKEKCNECLNLDNELRSDDSLLETLPFYPRAPLPLNSDPYIYSSVKLYSLSSLYVKDVYNEKLVMILVILV